jgi:putative oxidoreductase
MVYRNEQSTSHTPMRPVPIVRYAILIARVAFAATLLSAVADRFGVWGPHGAHNVAWGDWTHFVRYTGILNPYAPAPLIPVLAGIATALEILFAIALLTGFQLERAAYGAAILFALFALGMTVGTGIKSPLDASVFTDATGALLLGVLLTTLRAAQQPAAMKPQA